MDCCAREFSQQPAGDNFGHPVIFLDYACQFNPVAGADNFKALSDVNEDPI